MDRRSFLTSLIGGVAAASVGGLAVATAAPLTPAPTPAADLGVGEAEALDRADAEYSQYHRHRRYHHRRHYGHHRRYRGYRRPDRRTRPNSQR